MKRAAVIAYLVVLHLFLAGLLWRTDTVRAWRGHPGKTYTQLIREAQQRMDWTVPDGAAVFLGDSIMAGLATAAVEPASVNFGVGGQTSRELLATLPKSLPRAGRVYLMVGVNDLNGGQDPAFAELAERLRGHEVVWSGLIPNERSSVASANARIRALCAAMPRCTYVDASGIALSDGLHPSPEGYREWANRLRQASTSENATSQL